MGKFGPETGLAQFAEILPTLINYSKTQLAIK